MNSRYNSDAIAELENELLEGISEKPISDIDAELKQLGAVDDDYVVSTRSVISEGIKNARKQRLVDARTQLNAQKDTNVNRMINSVDEAQAFLFEAVQSGMLKQNGFTAAFREGEAIPDQDLIDLANQIKELMNSDEE